MPLSIEFTRTIEGVLLSSSSTRTYYASMYSIVTYRIEKVRGNESKATA